MAQHMLFFETATGYSWKPRNQLSKQRKPFSNATMCGTQRYHSVGQARLSARLWPDGIGSLPSPFGLSTSEGKRPIYRCGWRVMSAISRPLPRRHGGLIQVAELFRGTSSSVNLYPKEVARGAGMRRGASALCENGRVGQFNAYRKGRQSRSLVTRTFRHHGNSVRRLPRSRRNDCVSQDERFAEAIIGRSCETARSFFRTNERVTLRKRLTTIFELNSLNGSQE
jgi:hypothetical protein